MAVRALKWAAANFPGYYEAMKADKKPTVVNSSTFESFAAALNMVYKLQVLKKNLSRTRPARIRDYHVVDWTFKALFDQMMKKDAIDFVSEKDPAGTGVSDTIPMTDIRNISHAFLLQGLLYHFRDRCMLLLAVHSGARGDEIRRMRNFLWGGVLRLQCIGPCGFHVLLYRTSGEKQHNPSDVDYRWYAPHRDPLMCPQVALFFYYMAGYTLGGEEFPSGEADDDGTWESWRGECVFPQDKSRTTPMTYSSHNDATKSFLATHEIKTTATTHSLRKTSVQNADQWGLSEDVLQRMCHWMQKNMMQKRYLTQVPPEGALVAGNWPDINGKNYTRFFHPRFIILPTPALVEHMFPFLPRLRAVAALRKAEKKLFISQAAVLETIEYLAVVGFQGCLDLVYTRRCLDANGVCTNPVIKNIMMHPDFQERLQSYGAGHQLQLFNRLQPRSNEEMMLSIVAFLSQRQGWQAGPLQAAVFPATMDYNEMIAGAKEDSQS